jgi:hypothetical protein
MKRNLLTYAWAGILLCSGAILTAHASSSIVFFSVDMATNLANGSFNPPPPAGTGSDVVSVFGSFNGYANPGLILVQQGNSTVYTNSYNDTSDANGNTMAYRFLENGNAEPLSCYDNRAIYLPAVSGASVSTPVSFYGGNGPIVATTEKFQVDMSEEIEVGHFHPLSGDRVVVAGSMNGWAPFTAPPQYTLTNDPTILVTNNNFGTQLVFSNVYTAVIPISTCANTGTGSGGLAVTNEIQEWQFVELPGGSWGGAGPANNDQSGNRFFIQTTDQVLPLVTFNDAPYTPVATVTFNLDMSTIAKYDPNFEPNTVSAWGSFNGWSGPVNMTNNPSAANTNLYTATTKMSEGVAFVLQYRYTNSLINNWVYDYAADGGPDWNNNNNSRRSLTMPVQASVLVSNLPTVYFLDLAPEDVLSAATLVTFSVDMNGAVGSDGTVFGPGDNLYINGSFFGGTTTPGFPYPNYYAWSGGSPPVSAPYGAAYEMVQQGSSTIYTNTVLVPAGTPIALNYAYGIDPGAILGGPLQDEAPAATPHFRVLRSTGLSPYVMSTDTFTTNQPYQEPLFNNIAIQVAGNSAGGDLSIGKAVAGNVPVSWLGRPGAQLQTAASLAGPWTNHPETDGTNWTAGSSSVNGLVSQTNWPSAGTIFFRLVKP